MTTVTGSAGRYRFTTLQPGSYLLSFVAPNTLVPTHCHQGADDTSDSDACRIGFTHMGATTVFTVSPDTQQPDWDVGFTEPVTVRGYAYVDENHNGHVDLNESGIPGVTIILQDGTTTTRSPVKQQPMVAVGGSEVARTVTTADGSYAFTQLTPGRYQLLLFPPDGFTLTTPALLSLPPLAPGEILSESAGLVALQPTNLPEAPEPTHRLYLPFVQMN